MDIASIITFLRIISLFVSIVFVGIMAVYGLNILQLRKDRITRRNKHFSIGNTPKQTLSPNQKRWVNIVSQFKSSDVNLWRLAIIDADAMLDEMVSSMGYVGDTFGERLKNMQQQGVTWTDAAWDVHLLRNKLAHEGSRYPLNDREAYRAYRIYENLLESNGYLA